MFDVDKAVKYLDSHAQPKSISRCAHYTANAITMPAGGGQPMGRTESAKNFGPHLEAAGFKQVTDGTLQKGDVAVIQSIPGHPHGHMAMYDGKQWVSDFKQRTMYPGDAYRSAKPPYKIYRHKDAKGQSSGGGEQGITKQGAQLDKGDDHGVYVGPKKRHLSHKQANLRGGGKVTKGSATVFVGPKRRPVARVSDATTHGPIVIGEETVKIG